jgi:hypothetical protein
MFSIKTIKKYNHNQGNEEENTVPMKVGGRKKRNKTKRTKRTNKTKRTKRRKNRKSRKIHK